jgi:hypothetical protein
MKQRAGTYAVTTPLMRSNHDDDGPSVGFPTVEPEDLSIPNPGPQPRTSLQQTASSLAANVVRAVRKRKGQQHRSRANDKRYVCGRANRKGVSGLSWHPTLPFRSLCGMRLKSRDERCRLGVRHWTARGKEALVRSCSVPSSAKNPTVWPVFVLLLFAISRTAAFLL